MTAAADITSAQGQRGRVPVLGFCLLCCLLAGGATQRGMLIDAILQVIVIAGSAYALMSARWSQGMRAGLILFILIVTICVIQIVAVPLSLLEIGRPERLLPFTGGDPATAISAAPISLSVSRTIEATIFALVPVLFFIAVAGLAQGRFPNLLPYFVIGLACNLIAGALQYSLPMGATPDDLLGYEVMVGMFANENHFATLIFASLPLIVYFGFFHDRPGVALLVLALSFLILLATGSRAGILLGLGVVAISVGSLVWRGRISAVAMAALFIIFAIYGYGALMQIGSEQLDGDFGRREFALTTWRAVQDNWLWGTGLGTFNFVYPAYERPDMVHGLYVNHAHNDFLELLLEGGLAAAAAFSVYIILLIARAVQVHDRPLQRLALLSILVILLHSLVDYPLRTMAIAMTFAFLNALYFSDAGSPPDSRERRASHNTAGR